MDRSLAILCTCLCTCLFGCPIPPPDADDSGTGSDELDASDSSDSNDSGEPAVPCMLFVDVDAPPGGDGSSWASARNDLRVAVEQLVTTCDEGVAWVAEGIYTPPDADVVLRVRASVSIHGGFSGSEATLDERDVAAHPTILQQTHPEPAVVEILDIDDIDDVDDIADSVVIDGFVIRGDPSVPIEARGMGVVVDSAVDSDNSMQVVLQRDIIEGTSRALHMPGYGRVELRDAILRDNATTGQAAAIYQANSQVYVFDSWIADNHSQSGAAIVHYEDVEFSYFGRIELSNTTLIANHGGGGAIDGAQVVLEGCRVLDNPSGRSLRASLRLTLTDVEIAGNGGGVAVNGPCAVEGLRYADNAGPLDCLDLEVHDSAFVSNVGTLGGAIVARTTTEYRAQARVRVYDSIFVDNQAQRGGAIHAQAYWSLGIVGGDVVVTNGEFVGNHADEGGALYGPIDAYTSSFHGNVATTGSAIAAQQPQVEFEEVYTFPGHLVGCALWPDDVDSHSGHAIEHSCIPAGLTGFVDAGGNVALTTDPFVASDLDLDGHAERYLAPRSPCVDIGASFMGFDPSTRTTQTSQCSDAGPADAGVHHVPLEQVGPCP